MSCALCQPLALCYVLGLSTMALSVGAYRSWQVVQAIGIVTFLLITYGFYWLGGYLALLLGLR